MDKTALTLANWNDNNFITGEDIWISIGNNKKWRPDFAYRLDNDRVVLIEVKSDLVHVNEDWISAIKHILFGEERYIFILTNGMYYEVHLSGIPQSIKSIQAPTIEEILNWEKEVC